MAQNVWLFSDFHALETYKMSKSKIANCFLRVIS